jgi:hypothetical protein
LSPFGHPNSESVPVTEAGFSYITDEDLERSRQQNSSSSNETPNPNPKSDVLVLKHRRVSYPVHFKGGSIDSGKLTVGDIRDAAAEKLEIPFQESERIKLFYRGRNLKDNSRLAREEGLRSNTNSDILCVVGDPPPTPVPAALESDDDGEEEDEMDDVSAETEKFKKKRWRKKKTGKKKNRVVHDSTASFASESSIPNPDATYVPRHAPPKPSPSPAPQQRQPPTPKSPLEKLDEISSKFHTQLVPECIRFIQSSPDDRAKREYEHKRLTENILAQVLLKLDAVETEGDPEARQRRKDLVKEVQSMLNKLDEVVK